MLAKVGGYQQLTWIGARSDTSNMERNPNSPSSVGERMTESGVRAAIFLRASDNGSVSSLYMKLYARGRSQAAEFRPANVVCLPTDVARRDILGRSPLVVISQDASARRPACFRLSIGKSKYRLCYWGERN